MVVETAYIVWHNASTGEIQLWVMGGDYLIRRATVLGENGAPVFIGPPFAIVGVGDFSGDGNADILWHNSETGEIQLWVMDEHRLVRRATVLGEDGTPAFIGPPFSIVGVGDFSGDGNADILWHNSETGEIQLWVMNEHRLIRRATVLGENGAPVFIGPPFSIVGIGDFTRDGNADILWHNASTGEIQLWVMGGHRLVRRATVLGEDGTPAFIGPPFSIVGVGDFTRDGNADILWHNASTGEIQLWAMSEHRLTARATIRGEDGDPVFIGPPFSIVGVASRWQGVTPVESGFCGVPDHGGGIGPLAFGPPNNRWTRGVLKVSINTAGASFVNPPPPGPQTTAEAVIIGAFGQWQRASRFFSFSFVAPGSGEDIRVVFGGSGVDPRFGSAGGVLASGAAPEAGNLQFDSAEVWSANTLLGVSLHEIGHLLGLAHSNLPGGIMYPFLGPGIVLDRDAVDAITAMYGWLPQEQLQDRGTSSRACLGVVRGSSFTSSWSVPQMVWKGAQGDPGIYWAEFRSGKWSPQERVPRVGCSYSPVLTQVPVPGSPTPASGLLMAWKGVDDDQGLYWTRKLGDSWEDQRRVDKVGSSRAPALANLNGQVHMVWKGVDDDSGIWWSQYDGAEGWSPQQRIAGGKTSESPALVAYNSRLYMFWKGVEDDHSGHYSFLDPAEFAPIWKPAKPIVYATYEAGGAVSHSIGTTGAIVATTRGDSILLAWKGAEGDSSIWFSLFRDDTFSGQLTVPGAGTSVGPSVVEAEGSTFMAWKGVKGDSTIYWSRL